MVFFDKLMFGEMMCATNLCILLSCMSYCSTIQPFINHISHIRATAETMNSIHQPFLVPQCGGITDNELVNLLVFIAKITLYLDGDFLPIEFLHKYTLMIQSEGLKVFAIYKVVMPFFPFLVDLKKILIAK